MKNLSIYEINTRLWLRELSEKYGREVILENVPEEEVEEFLASGFDAIWLMGVWKPSELSRNVASSHMGLRNEFHNALPDLKPDDICASPYAIGDYKVNEKLGGKSGLIAFRELLKRHGIKLILDFIPNHTGMDHPWVTLHPEYYMMGSLQELKADPSSFFNAGKENNPVVIAHGKDPYFPGWTDTAQLNYFNPELRKAQINELFSIAEMCDGLRCDMAMLIMNEIHFQVWGKRGFLSDSPDISEEFWQEAISAVKERYPEFIFIAEAYWMKEGPLQQLGFDYTYDKALYDWLKQGDVLNITPYLANVPLDYHKRCVHFIENHDESRAASVMSREHHKSAALAISTLPGASLFHEGQLEGNVIKVPVQLGRRVKEVCDAELNDYYKKLLPAVAKDIFKKGEWTLLHPFAAWEGNYSYRGFLIWLQKYKRDYRLTVINFSSLRGQCYVMLPSEITVNDRIVLTDELGTSRYERAGEELAAKGLFLDMTGWQNHLFRLEY